MNSIWWFLNGHDEFEDDSENDIQRGILFNIFYS